MGDEYICLACGSIIDSESKIENYGKSIEICECCGKPVTKEVAINKTSKTPEAIPR
jgi:rRNA maturation endonuclease Nob1